MTPKQPHRPCAVPAEGWEHSEATSPFKNKKIKDTLLKQILDYLRLNYHLNAAFLLSKQTHTTVNNYNFPPAITSQIRQFTYTIVMITNKPFHHKPGSNLYTVIASEAKQPSQIMDEIYNHTQKQARVYIIPFTVAAVKKKMNFGCNFLTKILNHTPCVYKKDNTWEEYAHFTPFFGDRILEDIQREWETRFKRAKHLHETVSNIHYHQEPVVCFEALKNALEQTCLGLIYVFWEYKPGYIALPYLLHLCSLFTDLPNEIFPKSSYNSQHIHHHLCNARNNLLYKTRNNLIATDAERAWKKCGDFIEKVNILATESLTQVTANLSAEAFLSPNKRKIE